jgi:hypothetical protein
VRDVPLGRVTFTGNLLNGQNYTSTLTAVVPPASPGVYRVIVRTDIFNEVFEGAFEVNNRTPSTDTLTLTVDALQLGVPNSVPVRRDL